MAARDILQLGNPTLWQKSLDVVDPWSVSTHDIIRDLDDTLRAFRESHGYGRGIAAPQIGVLQRIIFVRMPDDGFAGPMINPDISRESDERHDVWDACFSFPDLVVRVSRAVEIQVDYLDAEGIRRTMQADCALAELLQHEIDHLDGMLAIQRAVSPTAFATRAEWERRYKR
jgi:peptide deformylase